MESCCEPGAIDAALDESAAIETAELFKVLADPVRVRLLSLIAAHPSREVCACDLVGVLDRSQPTISHHLKLLHESGLLDRERRGTWIHYSLADDIAERISSATSLVFAVPEGV